MTLNLNLHLNLDRRELIVDHFCGGGGASTGILAALGRAPDIAINHDAAAIAIHQANHPDTRHFQESIFDVDPHEATAGRPVGLLWASPSCTHFSGAKNGAPLDRKIRALSWVCVRWAAAVRPRVILMENVREFQSWGPLRKNHKGDMVRDKRRAGKTFRQFVAALEALGYEVDWRIINAADYGAPQSRRRFFLQARRDGQPITWPLPTHAQSVPAAHALDWHHLGERLDRRKRVMQPQTLAKIQTGLDQRGTQAPNGNRAVLFSHERGGRATRLDRPAPTLTTGDRLYVAQRDPQGRTWARTLRLEELRRLMGFPEGYALPGDRKAGCGALGNAVCPPVAAALVRAAFIAEPVPNAAD